MTLGSDATGDIYYRDASGFLEKLAASTDGHVLTSTGAGSIPAWEAGAGTSVGDNLAWTDYVETGTDENAKRVIIVDLDDPGTIWDYAQFMQQIQGTSWHDELGDPPMHGLMFITEANDKLIWWNRETGAAYMTFDIDTGWTMIAHSSYTLTNLDFLDGVVYLTLSAGGVNTIDFLRDQGVSYSTGGRQLHLTDIENRNVASSSHVVMNSSVAIVNNTGNAIAAVRDPSLTDEFGRPKHWWAVGTAGGLSVYNPVDDAIYDVVNNPNCTDVALSSNGSLAYIRDAGSYDILYVRSIFGVSADAFAMGAYWDKAAFSGFYLHTTAFSAATTMLSFQDGTSLAGTGEDTLWWAGTGAVHALHMPTTHETGVDGGVGDSSGGKIVLSETYASPYMKGLIVAAWPLHAVTDVGPLGHDLTNNNAVTFSNGGPAGSYANFVTASTMSLSLADHNDFDSMAELTVACWVNLDIMSQWTGLVAKHNGAQASWMLRITDANVLNFITEASGTTTNVFSGLTTGQWYHIVGAYDGTTSRLYINGVLVDSDAQSGSIDASTAVIEIGALSGGTFGWIDGQIGGVSVSATAMTEREIKAEYQRGLRRINSTTDTNDTISDNDVAAIAADPNGKYVAVMGDDKVVNVFDEFAVPVATDAYPGTTARDVAIKSMPGGVRHLIMAGSDQIELVQPDTEIAAW